MAKVKVFRKLVKLQGQGHKVKNYGTTWKVLSQGIHMCKYESPISSGKKVMAKVKVFVRATDTDADSKALAPRT